ncbi:MAG: hypothetical protein K0U78_15435 [Actinomycetia bacterium]|nr:hypothetical protein [Actinomycetes bacterium]
METKDIQRIMHSLEIREISDPIQTHAVYNVSSDDLDELKKRLRESIKAIRFRVVKTYVDGVVILCFKVK